MNNDVVPGPGDSASISMGYNVVANADVSVGSLSSSSPITFNGSVSLGNLIMSYISGNATFNGELYLADTLNLGDLMGGGGTFNGDVHINAGKALQLSSGVFSFGSGVDVDGAGLVKVMSATAGIGGNAVSFRNLDLTNSMSKLTGSGGTATIKNLMNFLGGRIEGSGTLVVESGELKLAGMMELNVTGWQVENHAVTKWTNGNVVTTSTTFTNEANAVFELGESAGNWTATGGQFQNQGTFNSSGMPAQGHTMEIEFVSTNVVNVLSGTLTLTHGGEFAGNAIANAAASLVLGGTLDFNLMGGFAFTGSGLLVTAGSNTVLIGTVVATNYELRTGSLGGPGTIQISNRLLWTGGTMTMPAQTQGRTEVLEGASFAIQADSCRLERRELINRGVGDSVVPFSL